MIKIFIEIWQCRQAGIAGLRGLINDFPSFLRFFPQCTVAAVSRESTQTTLTAITWLTLTIVLIEPVVRPLSHHEARYNRHTRDNRGFRNSRHPITPEDNP